MEEEEQYELTELTYLHGYYQARWDYEPCGNIVTRHNLAIIIRLIYDKIKELENSQKEGVGG